MPEPMTDVTATLQHAGKDYRYHSLAAAERAGLCRLDWLPFSLKVLLENLLRHAGDGSVEQDDIRAVGHWTETRAGGREIAFRPARVILPDSSGIPLLADMAAMRDAMVALGGDPTAINPLASCDLIVDHSLIVDVAGRPDARERNQEIEYARNGERYTFLRWAQRAFRNLRIVPPGNGIIHQVNLEFLARVVFAESRGGETWLYPDTVLGGDSHTPMINGLGIVGWGCGGIEAAAALLGQPVTVTVPEVVGLRLIGALKAGTTATDLVLTVVERLRRHGVVQKFVECCGPGLAALPVPLRATIANMSPEHGATVCFFPVDRQTVDYLRGSGRDDATVSLIETYARAQGLWRDDGAAEPRFTDVVEIDLGAIEPSVAGPRRPQDRMALSRVPASLTASVDLKRRAPVPGRDFSLGDGDIVIAAITSCTNTSDPLMMVGAGLLARNALARGLKPQPWVKTSFAPGSGVVAEYLRRAGLQDALDALGFHVVGLGCTTCMGNSGPLDPAVAAAITEHGLNVAAVLSGNRNFEGRVHAQCRLNYLASPLLVVAYALAGSVDRDLTTAPLGHDPAGKPVHLRDIWPADAEIRAIVQAQITPALYRDRYASAFDGDARWQALPAGDGDTFGWQPDSHYIRQPPFFESFARAVPAVEDIVGARALALLGNTITTDHISPVGAIPRDSLAGRYLVEQGVEAKDFNSYAARRVNHDVMMRGTFANPRLRNELAPDTEGGWTRHMPDGEVMPVFDAAMRYARDGVPLIVIAGADYGTGSSRDWAAKGARLLGVRAVLAEGFERIHRSNLIGMGVLPVQFTDGQTHRSLGLDGTETYSIPLGGTLAPRATMACRIDRADGGSQTIALRCRLDTGYELDYFRNGGILPYMLRRIADTAA